MEQHLPPILDSLSDKEILGLTLVGEARGEPIEGQVAVASVVRNRMGSDRNKYPGYKDVCLEPKQFSCWNSDDPNYPMLMELAQKLHGGEFIRDPYIRQCMLVAAGIIDWDILDNTKGAVHYMTHSLFYSAQRPKWARVPVGDPITHGNQIFFNV